MPARSVAAALVGAAALVAVPAAGAQGAHTAHTAPLRPPVIHEPFTPLPCTGAPANRTTLQQEGCTEQQILKTDARIDALNRTVFARLTGGAARRRFVAAHAAWLSYRHAYCLSASDVFEGGSAAPVAFAACEVTVNQQDIRNLTAFAHSFG